MKDRFIKMKVSDLAQPKDGRMVYMDRWWIVNADEEVLFSRTYSRPQCSTNRGLAERLKQEGCRLIFMSLAFVPIEWSDYT